MGMKPRLNDGPVQYSNLVSQPKAVGESTPLPVSNLSSCSKEQSPTSNEGGENLSSKVGK